VILVDTGPLVAAALGADADHHACVELLTGLHLARRRILIPSTVVAEVGYLLAREGGPRVEAGFLTSLADGDFASVNLTSADFRRMASLVEQYADLPLGTTDASLIALAERLDIAEIATLDRRHFTVVRPRHVEAFDLVP
jgi:predicted nucleic acid-binding protein